MILLHARNEVITGLRLGLVRLGRQFLYPAEPEEKIATAIVLLAPKECSCYELETIGHISSILLERWGLIEMLHEGDERQIKAELIRIFRDFYEVKHQELMEG
jgi:mannitol operon transcriptional antiterminator